MSEREDVVAALFGQPWAILPEAMERLILSAREPVASAASVSTPTRQGGRCAIIPIVGPIVPHAGWFDDIFGVVSLDALNDQLAAVLADPNVERIILHIDSPGGQATGVHEFAARVRLANKAKPVVSYVYGMAASAAYWIAAAAGKIVANRTADVGSIGVIYAWTDDTAAREARGLKDYVLVSSQSPKKHLDLNTRTGRAELQALADSLADIFIDEVAAYRGVSRGRVTGKFGKGRVMMAEAALAAGMIDEIGILEAVLAGDIGRIEREHVMKLHMPTPGARAKAKGRAEDEEDEDKREASTEDEREDEDDAEAKAEGSNGGDDDDDDASAEAENENEGDDEKKPDSKKAKASMTLDRFKAEFPGVFKAACAVGAKKERQRIKSIFELGVVGHDDLVREAVFGAKPMQARDLAYAVTLEQKKVHADMLSGTRMDAESAQVGVAPISAEASGTEAAWEKRLVDAMSGGLKGAL